MSDRNYVLVEFESDVEDSGWGAPQFHEIPVVPTVGSFVSVWSSRDGAGNYVYDSPQLCVEGIVKEVRYTFEERGSAPQVNTKQCYVHVVLDQSTVKTSR